MRWLVALALVAIVGVAGPAGAEPTAGHAGPGGPFGLGLVLGQPSGLSAEIGLGGAHTQAVEIALGLDLLDHDQVGYLHLVWKWYVANLVRGNPRLPLYVGLGGFVIDAGGGLGGVRAPLGLALDFPRTHLQLFFELAFDLLLVDRVDAELGGALGFHWFF